MSSYLEPEHAEAFNAWKANPSQEANRQILDTLSPMIDTGIRAHVGEPNPLLTSQARRLTLDALQTYDPNRSRLRTHVVNNLQGLKRINRKLQQGVTIPERVSQDAYRLTAGTQELQDRLGREPTDAELSDHLAFPVSRIAHVRKFRPAVAEGTMAAVLPSGTAAVQPGQMQQTWTELVYDDLPTIDKTILEHTLGLHGRPMLSNQQLAVKLGHSPGSISQHKQRIQSLLDQEEALSPFRSR